MKKWNLDRCGAAMAVGMFLFAIILMTQRNDQAGEVNRISALSAEEQAVPMVVSVNRDWGFVILEGTGEMDLAENDSLEVVRDGDVLANLIVKVTEKERVVAEILPGSVASYAELVSGDLVR